MQNCGPNTCMGEGGDQVRPSTLVRHQQSRQQGIDKGSNQQDIALACYIEQEGGAHHDQLRLWRCPVLGRRPAPHQGLQQQTYSPSKLVEQEASTVVGSRALAHEEGAGGPQAQPFMHLGLLCCFHQHADRILRLQQCDIHTSMPGRLMEAVEALHSGRPPE